MILEHITTFLIGFVFGVTLNNIKNYNENNGRTK